MLETQLSGNYKDAITVMHPALVKLIKNYDGWGKSERLNEAEYPQIEIQNFLKQLDIYYPGASKRKLKLAIRSFITNLSCFKYRVIARVQEQTQIRAWNPLEESYKQFIDENRNHQITYRANESPHPVADLISDWVTQNIDEDIYAE